MPASPDATANPTAGTAKPAGGRRRIFVIRLASTLVLWAVLSASISSASAWPFYLLTMVLGLGAFREYLWMERSVPRAYAWTALGISFAYYIAVFAICSRHPSPRAALASADLFFAFLAVASAFLPALFGKIEGRQTLWNIIYPGFGFFYVPVLFSFMARIIFLPWSDGAGGISPPASGMFYFLFLLLATKFTDAGAYAFGSLWGKHKLIAHISPAKTWEGLAGAFSGAALAGMIAYALAKDKMPLLSWGSAFCLCLLIALVCVFGDLAESIVKRSLGVKDSGKFLPGIGGAFDLVDSLLLTGPLVYFFLSHAC